MGNAHALPGSLDGVWSDEEQLARLELDNLRVLRISCTTTTATTHHQRLLNRVQKKMHIPHILPNTDQVEEVDKEEGRKDEGGQAVSSPALGWTTSRRDGAMHTHGS